MTTAGAAATRYALEAEQGDERGSPEASTLFQGEVRDNFSKHGYEELQAVCCIFYRAEIDSLRAGHGDDFVVEAFDEELDKFDDHGQSF